MSAILAIAGLTLNLIGVVILFLFGMPFHVPQGGAVYLAARQQNTESLARERRYKVLGWIGLALIVAGTIAQAAGVLTA